MKKITAIVSCVLLLIMLAMPVFAATSATLTLSQSTVYRGGTFEVTVKLSGAEQASGGSVRVVVDDALQVVEGKWTISGVTGFFEADKNSGVFMYSNGKINVNGNVFVLKLKAENNVAFGTYNIKVQLQINGEDVVKTTTVKVICNHKYGNWTSAGNTKHSHKCSICGNTETENHTYDNACDTTCNGCGATRTITHQYSEEWVGDETGHWHACTVCGVKDTVVEHTPGEEAGEYTDQVCTVCNFVLTPALGHQHRYEATYESDETGHWKTCTGCGEKAGFAEHDFDGSCDTTCDKCGYQREITHKEGAWKSSDTEHWQTCTSCKAELNKSEHSWDAGIMEVAPTTTKTGVRVHKCSVCDAVKREPIPVASVIDPIGGWPWWIWTLTGFGGGMLLTAGVGLLVIVLSVKKKSKGRFSSK